MRKCHARAMRGVWGARASRVLVSGRRAETIFVSSVASAARGESSNKVREPETASPARETPAHRRASCALPNRARRFRRDLVLHYRFALAQILDNLLD